MTSKSDIPKFDALLLPVVRALKSLGGSASIQELLDRVIQDMQIREDIRTFPHGSGPRTELEYRLAWARTYLKAFGAISNSERGVWSLENLGENLTESDIPRIKRYAREMASTETRDEERPDSDEKSGETWKDALIDRLLQITPDAFERLAQRILRESGFVRVEVTGRASDGGIDGTGILRVNLISFHVIFQCKRWKSSVGASTVRDFRGAMVGRADKGLIITTSTFTADARAEASRDGAPAIDLVDGDALCELLKSLKLGVKTTQIEKIEIESEFFKSI